MQITIAVKIGGVGILSDLDDFAKRVQAAANIKKEEDEILNDAPEEFLDPIMSTLMSDPVILPSSKITVDRQTISRYKNMILLFVILAYVCRYVM